MSYKITLRDKTEMIVPDDAGQALADHLLRLKKSEYLEIAGSTYLSSHIISVAKTTLAAAGQPDNRTLQAPKYSCGQFSIEAEIHRRALRDKKNWPSLVRDKAWREKTRKEIRAEDPKREWCDHRAGTHACQSE